MFIEAAGPGSAGGPIGTIIGGLIDLGELFGGLFGLFGGGGSSLPDLSPNAWSPSPALGDFGNVDISGLSGGWWSQCGFLYGSVCGVAPMDVVIPYHFSVDATAKTQPDSVLRLESARVRRGTRIRA